MSMFVTKLLKLYPNGILSKKQATTTTYLSLPIDDGYFIIEKAQLTIEEQKLLETFFLQENPANLQLRHNWYNYLFRHLPLSKDEGVFRILQFHLEKTDHLQKSEWEIAIRTMFPTVTDFFFLNETDGLIIEPFKKNHYSLKELEDIFLTLDMDFNLKTIVFVGSFFPTTMNFPLLFKEEQQFFKEEITSNQAKQICTFTEIALRYFIKDRLKDSPTIQRLKQQIANNSDIQKIIFALWHHQGNISSTAKELFMHRNTLHYRLDKFYEQTGLSLKKMDDLVLCYLILEKQ